MTEKKSMTISNFNLSTLRISWMTQTIFESQNLSICLITLTGFHFITQPQKYLTFILASTYFGSQYTTLSTKTKEFKIYIVCGAMQQRRCRVPKMVVAFMVVKSWSLSPPFHCFPLQFFFLDGTANYLWSLFVLACPTSILFSRAPSSPDGGVKQHSQEPSK